MKIVGVAVTLREDHKQILQVSILLNGNEELEDADIQRVLDAARELGGDSGGTRANNADPVGDKTVSRDPKDEVPHGAGAGAIGGRRRRGTVAADPVGGTGAASDLTDNHVAATPEGRRRRGAANPTTADAAPAVAAAKNDASDQAPVAGRRRRVSSGAEDAAEQPEHQQETTATTASPSEEGGRRRRSVPTESPNSAHSQGNAASAGRQRRSPAPQADGTDQGTTAGTAPSTRANAAPSSSSKISDEDLMKAVSETARKIGSPEPVKDLLRSFAVGTVGAIEQQDRQDFLEALAKMRAGK